MKRLFILFFALMTQITHSQKEPFEEQWRKMEGLELKGGISTALDLSQEIMVEARKQKSYGDLLKAKIFYYKFYQITHEGSNNFILADINSTLSELPLPYSSVWQSYKADFLQQYYQQHRWTIQNRTRVDTPAPEDLETWSAATLRDSIRQAYDLSLNHVETLIKSSPEIVDELVLASPLGRKYRPSLFDLLAYRALDFYSDQSNFPEVRPEQEFAFTSESLYADTRAFQKLDLKPQDESSAIKVLRTFQQLENLHSSRKNPDAAVYAQLARLEYVNENFRGPGNWELYTAALERLAKETKGEAAAPVLLAQAKVLQQRADETDEEGKLKHPNFLKKAVELCEQIIREYPDTDTAQNAQRLISAITAPSISSKLPEYLANCEPGRLFVSYKSMDSLRLRIIKLPHQQDDYLPYHQRDSLVTEILKKESVEDRLLFLPQAEDHNQHSTEFVLEGLEKGSYFVHLSGKGHQDREGYSYGFVKVSDLVLTETSFDDHSVYKVLERRSGAPVPGARLQFFNNENEVYRDQQTNAAGLLKMNKGTYTRSGKVLVTKEGDSLSSYYSNYGRSSREKEILTAKSLLYLDRHIYRPGQKVFFKGVLLKRETSETSTVPSESLDVVARDANGKEFFRKSLKTNKYGSFSGEFDLPKSGITGVFSIHTEEGEASKTAFWDVLREEGNFIRQHFNFSVEEYKRPTFEVSFDDTPTTFSFGDSVQVKGMVESFMGSPINAARLTYTVTRQKMVYTWWRRHYEEEVTIKTDTVTTDAQGRFSLGFPAEISRKDLHDEDLVYNYSISATVTDVSGETRVGSHSLKLGKKNLLLDLQLPETTRQQDSLQLLVRATDLNDQPVPVTGELKIYKLQGPDRILRERLWEAPEIQTIPEEEFKHLFPEEPYSEPQDPMDWSRGKLVYQTRFADTATIDRSLLPDDWQSGRYLVEVSARNAGNTAESKRSFTLVNPQDTYLPDNQRFSASLQNSNFAEEGEVHLLLQTAYQDLKVQVSLYDGYTSVFDSFVQVDGRKEFRIPLKGITSKAVEIQVHALKNNSLIKENLRVPLERPKPSLTIETETFRNKIQPGQEETWSFRITDPEGETPDAEILASMYDASLDQFQRPYVKGDWTLEPGFYTEHLYFPNLSTSTVGGYNHMNDQFPYSYGYNEFQRSFDELNHFGFDFSDPHSWAYRSYLQKLKAGKISSSLIGNTRGRVTDEYGRALAGVNVLITGTSTGTRTNQNGEFALDTKKGNILSFSFLGYTTREVLIGSQKEIFVTLEGDASELNEVVEVAEYSDSIEEEADMGMMQMMAPPPPAAEMMELSAKVSGVRLQNSDGTGQVLLNYGSGSDTPLFIVDGEIVTEHQLDASDIVSTEMLTSQEAMALYGASAANGAVIITTRKGMQDLQQVEARKDLDETAFFFPHLSLEADGGLKFSFTSPEALTQWKFRLLAHTSTWTTGSQEQKVVTQKDLSVTPNAPRFLREGDSIVFKTKVTNMTSEAMTGTALLQLFDAITMEPIDELLLALENSASGSRAFQIAPNSSTAVGWKLYIPQGVQAVTYRVLAKAGTHSDGEENLLPVLSNRMLVHESLPMFVRAGETETYTFDNLKNNSSETLEHHKFSLEYTANPAWYAIQSLPYLMEFEHECSEQIFSRIYANSLASHVVNSQPKIREVFEKWRGDGSLVSPLERNEELKSLILAETPWVRDAASEEEQKQRLAELFQLEKLSSELEENIDKLAEMQRSSGAFPWFAGGDDNYFITRHIVAGFGHLETLGVDIDKAEPLLEKAIEYLDREMLEQEKQPGIEDLSFFGSYSTLHYLYTRSFFMGDYPPSDKVQKLIQKIVASQKEDWLSQGLYAKALLLVTLPRFNEQALAEQILVSLEESAVRSDDYGMYWKENTPGWFWYRAPIETQALLIEGFSEVGTAPEAVEEMKIWLLQNKRTSHWPTTKATTEAVYALLMQGQDWLQLEDNTQIELGGKPLPSEKLKETEKEAGTGYRKLSWKGEEVEESFSRISITNNNKVPGYGGAYWQYFEDLDKIGTHSESPLNIEKELYLQVSEPTGSVLKQITPETLLKPGDLVTVRLVVRSTADMDYIHLKDMRASGFEPTNVMSEYKYQDGTAYYESTRDAATHFFFDRLRKGTYVLEYTVRANNAGNFSNGITTIESMYAPEFSGHTKGIRVNISE